MGADRRLIIQLAADQHPLEWGIFRTSQPDCRIYQPDHPDPSCSSSCSAELETQAGLGSAAMPHLYLHLGTSSRSAWLGLMAAVSGMMLIGFAGKSGRLLKLKHKVFSTRKFALAHAAIGNAARGPGANSAAPAPIQAWRPRHAGRPP